MIELVCVVFCPNYVENRTLVYHRAKRILCLLVLKETLSASWIIEFGLGFVFLFMYRCCVGMIGAYSLL